MHAPEKLLPQKTLEGKVVAGGDGKEWLEMEDLQIADERKWHIHTFRTLQVPRRLRKQAGVRH